MVCIVYNLYTCSVVLFCSGCQLVNRTHALVLCITLWLTYSACRSTGHLSWCNCMHCLGQSCGTDLASPAKHRGLLCYLACGQTPPTVSQQKRALVLLTTLPLLEIEKFIDQCNLLFAKIMQLCRNVMCVVTTQCVALTCAVPLQPQLL